MANTNPFEDASDDIFYMGEDEHCFDFSSEFQDDDDDINAETTFPIYKPKFNNPLLSREKLALRKDAHAAIYHKIHNFVNSPRSSFNVQIWADQWGATIPVKRRLQYISNKYINGIAYKLLKTNDYTVKEIPLPFLNHVASYAKHKVFIAAREMGRTGSWSKGKDAVQITQML